MDLDVKDHLEQLGVASARALLSRTPVGVATDTFFEYQTQVKLERLYRIIEELREDIESIDPKKINWEHLQSEEFSDLFESILRRAVNTAAEEKIRRFKKILMNEMTRPYKSDFKETFLDIAYRINEDQIQILKHFWNAKNGCEGDSEQRVIDGEGTGVSFKSTADLQGFEEAKYLFYVQDLVSKSLLLDEAVALFGGEIKPYTNLKITPFGEEFLKFIEGSPDQ